MENIITTSLIYDTNQLIKEIRKLNKQLNYEKAQHQHWEELAMIFHDALWQELKQNKKQ